MIKRTALALTLVALLGTSALAGLAAAHQRANSHHSKPWVYESKRPALKVSITRRGHRVVRADVSAPGRCTNGEHVTMGFGLSGGRGLLVDRHGRFHNPGGVHQDFRGRFVGNRVIGVFYETFRRSYSGEEQEPTCGNIRSHGRVQHFVARLVKSR